MPEGNEKDNERGNEQGSKWWIRFVIVPIVIAIIGGGGITAIAVAIVPYIFPTPQSSLGSTTDKIAGTWVGATNWNEYQGLQNTITIKPGCAVGDTCGTTRMDSQYWCSGNLLLSKIDGEIFTFIQTNQQGNVPDDGCENGAIETMYLLSPDKLSWTVSRTTGNNPGTGSGVLQKQP
jgi:hypothetical protein